MDMPSSKHINYPLFRVFRSEAYKVNDGSLSAKIVMDAFNQLSEFKMNPIGTAVLTGYDDNLIPASKDLDFEVVDNTGKRIAQLDTTGSNWTYKASRIMPVRDYKGKKVIELGLPCFFVYWMKRESGPVKECCYWIKGEDVIKVPLTPLRTKEKMQYNHNTNKADWHQGLESLIEELKSLTP